MTNSRRVNGRHVRRNSRYTPPRPIADLYDYNDFANCVPRSILGKPQLLVINYPVQPQPEVVAGVLALFLGGENLRALDSQVVISRAVGETRESLAAVFPTSLGLAHVLYIHEVHTIALHIGYSDSQDLSRFLSDEAELFKNLNQRKGDGEWFLHVSSTVAMREALDIAARAGIDAPSGFAIDEYCVELIRNRWNFGSDTSFVEAVKQGMNDARRITSRRKPALVPGTSVAENLGGHSEGMTRNHLEEVALQLLEQTRSDHVDPYRIENARLFAISVNEVRLLGTSADVYTAIASIPCLHKTIGDDLILAIETCGFASPVDDQDVPPSVHPKRRRVRLVVVSNRDGDSGSALEFSDAPGEPITTPSGQGHLADELSDAMRRLELIQSLPLNDPRRDESNNQE